ncbi:hypothetical protein [Streptomyces sp. Tu 4128]|uniref:hypothetical protein n=1 Tax=unclassified Streptomyces TaxID=2593676 RepID=UPI001F11ED2F|nr:hypothetical protein [Streptomyces sp. Tu 4128]
MALAVVVLGNSNISTGDGKTPRPQTTAQYPIRFEGAPAARAPQPQPTVSYPIRWQR